MGIGSAFPPTAGVETFGRDADPGLDIVGIPDDRRLDNWDAHADLPNADFNNPRNPEPVQIPGVQGGCCCVAKYIRATEIASAMQDTRKRVAMPTLGRTGIWSLQTTTVGKMLQPTLVSALMIEATRM